jgi:hypothetical protein
MKSIKDFKAEYPEYQDWPDDYLADQLHQKYYSDVDRSDFMRTLGLEGPGIGRAIGAGIQSGIVQPLGGLVAGAGALVGSEDIESAGRDIVQSAQEGVQSRMLGAVDYKDLMDDPTPGKVGRFIVENFGMQAPQLATMLGASLVGGPVGLGAALGAQFTGSNVARQIEEGEPIDWKSVAAAVPQAGAEFMVAKAFGLTPGGPIAKKLIDNLGGKSFLTRAGAKVGELLAVGVPGEVIQQGLERWAANQDIDSEEAGAEYGEAAIRTLALLGPLGAGAAALGGRTRKTTEATPAEVQGPPVPPGPQGPPTILPEEGTSQAEVDTGWDREASRIMEEAAAQRLQPAIEGPSVDTTLEGAYEKLAREQAQKAQTAEEPAGQALQEVPPDVQSQDAETVKALEEERLSREYPVGPSVEERLQEAQWLPPDGREILGEVAGLKAAEAKDLLMKSPAAVVAAEDIIRSKVTEDTKVTVPEIRNILKDEIGNVTPGTAKAIREVLKDAGIIGEDGKLTKVPEVPKTFPPQVDLKDVPALVKEKIQEPLRQLGYSPWDVVPRADLEKALGREKAAEVLQYQPKMGIPDVEFTPDFQAKSPEVFRQLSEELEKLFPGKNVDLKIVDTLTRQADGRQATGNYANGLITMALDAPDKSAWLRHEGVHAARDLGLWTPQEWNILERAAKDRLPNIREKYPDLDKEGQLEEAIGDLARDSHLKEPVRSIFQKFFDFLDRVGNVLRGNGFQNSRDVFRKFEAGEVGRRPVNPLKDYGAFKEPKYGVADFKVLERLRENIRSTPIPEGVVDATAAEMSRFAFNFNTPSLVANRFPSFRPLWDLITQRRERRASLVHDYLQKIRPSGELSKAGTNRLTSLFEATSMERRAFEEDAQGLKFTPATDGFSFKAGNEIRVTDPQEVQAAKGMRDFLQKAWEDRIGAMKKVLGIEGETVDSLRAAEENDLADLLQEMESASRDGYFPSIRNGDTAVVVRAKKDGKASGPPVYLRTFDFQLGKSATKAGRKDRAIRVAKELLKTYPPDTYEVKVSDFNYSKWQELGMKELSTLEMINSAMNMDSPEASQMFKDLRTEIQKRGFKAHLTKRDNIPGFLNEDTAPHYLRSAATTYAFRAAGHISNLEFFKDLSQAQKNIEDPRLAQYSQELLDYTFDGREPAGWLKTVAFHWTLGFNLASAMTNLTQVPMVTFPWLAGATGATKAANALSKAYKMAMPVVLKAKLGDKIWDERPGSLDPQTWAALREAHRRGILNITMTQDIIGAFDPSYMGKLEATNRFVGKGLESSAELFGRAETLNRLVTWLAARNLYQSSPEIRGRATEFLRGTRHEGKALTPDLFADIAVEETQFIFGKEGRARFMRHPSFRGVAEVATQFMNFPLRSAELWYQLAGGKGAKNKQALALMGGMLFLGAGAYGLPQGEATKDALEAIIKLLRGEGINLDQTVREMLQPTAGHYWTEALLKGLPAASGIDMSKRIGLEIIPSRLFEGDPTALLGPTGAIVKGFQQSQEFRKQGFMDSALFAAMPTFLRNMWKAQEMATEGVRTSRGTTVAGPEKFDVADIAAQGIGLSPTKKSSAYESVYAVKRMQKEVADKRENFSERAARALVKSWRATAAGDRREAQMEYQEVLKEAREYDKGKAPPYRVNLNPTNIKKRAEGRFKGVVGNVENLPRSMREEARKIYGTYGL